MSTIQGDPTGWRRAAIARRVITEGHPVILGWYEDGDAEGGPRGGTHRLFRHGPLWVERINRPNLSAAIFVAWEPRRYEPGGYPLDGTASIYPGEEGYDAVRDLFETTWADWENTVGITIRALDGGKA